MPKEGTQNTVITRSGRTDKMELYLKKMALVLFCTSLLVFASYAILGDQNELLAVKGQLSFNYRMVVSKNCSDGIKTRVTRIRDTCALYKKTNGGVDRFKPNYFMIVDDIHKVILCWIPKVGCSTFQTLVAQSMAPNHNASATRIHFPSYLHSFGIKYLYEYPKKDIELRMKTYFKFIVVRHPFDRLLSAYADKFMDPDRNMMTFSHLKKRAELRFGKFARFDKKGQGLLTLNQFLELIANDGHFRDKHWERYSTLCQPCSLHFDHVIRLETVNDDIGPVLKRLNMTKLMIQPENVKRNATNKLAQVSDQFKKIEPRILKGLLKFYKRDFELFGYTWTNSTGAGC